MLVFLGGAAGTLARWASLTVLPGWVGLALVNTLGAFALGLLAGRLAGRGAHAWLALGTGFLGGFTTYSTLAVTVLSPDGAVPLLLAAGVVAGMVAALLGLLTGRRGTGAPR